MERRTVVYDAEASDDHERQGTVWTATSHIVAAVVGSGVLALAWTVAQLGWVVGPLVLLGFSCVTYYTSALLADCYRYPDPVDGAVNKEYIDAVRCYLDRKNVILCGCAQYVNLWGTLVGYTITASTSMIAVRRVNCFHRSGYGASECNPSGSTYMVVFGLFQLLLSQLPSLHNIAWLSVVAVATSFGYSFISLGLCAAKWASHGGAVFAQPIFARLESCVACRWPDAKLINATYYVRVPWSSTATVAVAPLKLVLRTILIMFTTLVAMLLPFFNAVLGLIGALGFWPLSVYFPVSMHVARLKIRRGEMRWWLLQAMSFVCLLISIAASIGSVQDIVHNLKAAAPFK
ncbi:hypothetical protein PR202_ga03763 [Eleusine coracana subsp. coracana]|uniref:Amino acid transporter transmembrane domain-containing protein n=1 Tax=Eleusine coracana subsp. coracana TaxID=191504 RepID=A0AAV5BPE5_ELECO|nr:hypothetical protein PR202_ga03763 [Eleusine coracana subsp. coracana]